MPFKVFDSGGYVMYIRVYGKNYKARQSLSVPARSLIMQFLDQVKKQSKVKGMEEFYTAVIVMMYVISSSILKELSVKNLSDLYKDIPKETENKKK